jgi:hypothetical protein
MSSSINTMMHGVRGFFRIAHIDGLIPADPAVYARLPKIHHDETRTQGLDRLELIRFLQGRPDHHRAPRRAAAPTRTKMERRHGRLWWCSSEGGSFPIGPGGEVEREAPARGSRPPAVALDRDGDLPVARSRDARQFL